MRIAQPLEITNIKIYRLYTANIKIEQQRQEDKSELNGNKYYNQNINTSFKKV